MQITQQTSIIMDAVIGNAAAGGKSPIVNAIATPLFLYEAIKTSGTLCSHAIPHFFSRYSSPKPRTNVLKTAIPMNIKSRLVSLSNIFLLDPTETNIKMATHRLTNICIEEVDILTLDTGLERIIGINTKITTYPTTSSILTVSPANNFTITGMYMMERR